MEMDGWIHLQNSVQMDSLTEKEKKNLDYAQLAIQRLMERRRDRRASGDASLDDEHDDHLLSKLLSQLESLKEDAVPEQPPATTNPKDASTSIAKMDKTSSNTDSESDEIIKELKKVKKQNTITHWLLSIMIVLMVTWQLSEVSLLLMIKNRVKNPFKSFGNMLGGMLQIKGPKAQDDEKLFKQHQIETTSLPHLTLPSIGLLDSSHKHNGGEEH